MIYTAHFANKKIPRDYCRIGIARFRPRWEPAETKSVLDLAPTPAMLKMDYKEYCRAYTKMLAQRDPHAVLKQIQGICGDRIPVLLCYEVPDDEMIFAQLNWKSQEIADLCLVKGANFCHRHFVSRWFLSHGIQCQEYKVPTQAALF